MVLVHGLRAVIQVDGPVTVNSGVGSMPITHFFTTEYIYRETAAVIQGHSHAIRVDVVGDHDAHETDPSYRVV